MGYDPARRNGVIFVLLGEQMPGIATRATSIVETGAGHDAWWLPLYVVAIMAALLVVRFVWVAITLRLILLKSRWTGEKLEGLTWHLVASTSVAGVKGAITLAGVLTLPDALPSGQPFPARDLAISIAMGVILLSLITATLSLPSLLARLKLPKEPPQDAEEDAARAAAGKAAMRAIESLKDKLAAGEDDDDLFAKAADRAMERYSRRALVADSSVEARNRNLFLSGIEQRLRLAAFKAERETFYRLRRERKLEDGLLRRLVREVDLLESRFSQ